MIIEDMYAFLIVTSASILLSLLITLVYKFTTNQKEMKHIKEQMKKLQTDMKSARNDQKKMLQINNELMKHNSQYMMKSLRSSMFTLLPALLVFVFLSNHIAYAPITPDSEFNLTLRHANNIDASLTEIMLPAGFEVIEKTSEENIAKYKLKAGEPGEYSLEFSNAEDTISKSVMVTEGREYAKAEEKYQNSNFNSAKIDYKSLTIVRLPFWPREMNWLWLYIIFAIIAGSLSRKVLNVY